MLPLWGTFQQNSKHHCYFYEGRRSSDMQAMHALAIKFLISLIYIELYCHLGEIKQKFIKIYKVCLQMTDTIILLPHIYISSQALLVLLTL